MSAVSRKLQEARPVVFAAWCMLAAFGTYFCMYAYRKPFTAGTYEGESIGSLDYKTVLVVSQVLGYCLSKFIGIKVISEMSAGRRAAGILVLIGMAHLSLLLFALVPPPYNFWLLFFNGLPLGMVFGLVLLFLEGRQLTEALTAGLCASFIVSSGVVKSVGRYLIVQGNVSEYWMPFVTGLIFWLPTLVFVAMLNQIPPPSPEDVARRSSRGPMTRQQRWSFVGKYAFGLAFLLSAYVLLTIMRSVRDDFAVEIWRDLGESGNPPIFAQSETLVMLGVVAINGAAVLVRDNRQAWMTAMFTVLIGFLLTGVSVIAFQLRWISAFPFMVLVGLGMYIAYVAYHTTVFERMLAVFRHGGNIGFLMYLADAGGYLAYVGLIIYRSFGHPQIHYLTFFLNVTIGLATLSLVLILASTWYFQRRMTLEVAKEG